MPDQAETTATIAPPKIGSLSRFKSWVKLHPRRALALMGAFLVIFSGGVLAFVSQQKIAQVNELAALTEEETSLLLLESDPPDLARNVPLDKKFSFRFNQKVDPLDVEQNLTITPPLKGSFKNGETENEVIFVPEKRLPAGSNISVQISENLHSKDKLPLVTPIFLSFLTDIGDKSVLFAEKDTYSGTRLMSFSKDKDAQISVMVGEGLDSVTLNLYKANMDQLLGSLSYQKEKEANYEYEVYTDKTVEAYKMEKLTSKTEVKNEDIFSVKQDIGVYYLEALNNEKERVGQTWLVFNTKGLLFRQDDKKIVLAAQDLNGGPNDDPIQVSLYSLFGSPKILDTDEVTDQKEISLIYPQEVDLIVGKTGNEVLIIPVTLPDTLADIRVQNNWDTKGQLFLYTDRPLYKKGDKVYFRGLLRKDNDALYKISTKAETIRITATNYLNNKTTTVLDQKVLVKDGGVFNGEFVVNQNFVGGGGIRAEVVGENPDYNSVYADFSVADYQKPNFDLEVRTDKSEYKKGDKIMVTFVGKQNDGKPLANTEVSYGYATSPYYETDKAVFNENFNLGTWGGMCGGGFFQDFYLDSIDENSPKVKLNSEGKAFVTINSSDIKGDESQEVVIVSLRKDEHGNKILGANKVVLQQGDINIFIRGKKTTYFVGDEMKVPFYAESRSGQKQANQTFNYGITKVTYDNQTYESSEEVVLVGTAVTDGNGNGLINQKLDLDTSNNYFLKVWGKDSVGRVVSDSKYFYVYDEANRKNAYNPFKDISFVTLNVSAEKNSYLVGETVNLKVEAPEDMKALLTLERGRIYKKEWVELKQGENTVPIEVTSELSPSFAVVFTFFRDGHYLSEGLSLNAPAMHKLINVEIKADKIKYLPGEKAKLTITTKDNKGTPISAKLSLSLVDKAIYSLKKDSNLSIHSSFYSFRSRMTNASSSLTKIGFLGGFGGGGGGGTGGDKLVDTLYWNPNLQTNTSGTVTVEATLNSYETTWRALTYASTNDTQVGQDSLDFIVSK